MNAHLRPAAGGLDWRLGLYGLAAGAAATGTAQAGSFLFDPPGGLPIVVTMDNTLPDAGVVLDIDGDAIDDVQFFYTTDYGGGFGIASVPHPTVPADTPRVRRATNSAWPTPRVFRFDHDESIAPVECCYTYRSEYSVAYTAYSKNILDADASPVDNAPAYHPFRERPGYIGIALGAVDSHIAAALQVQVNADGSELRVLGGRYGAQQGEDLRLRPDQAFSGGFEPIESPYFDTIGALGNLASGQGEQP